MIKVLNILSDTNIGGAGRAVLNYLKFMDSGEFMAGAAVPRGSLLIEPLRELDIPVFEVDAMADKSFDTSAVAPLTEVIREFEPDIVHTHGSLSGRIAGKKCGKKVVFTRHSAFPFPSYVRKTPLKLIYRYLYSHYADRIVVISPAGEKLLTDIGVPKEKLAVIMNGAEAVGSLTPDERSAKRGALGVGEDDFVIGILARVEEYKGHTDILEALKLLRDGGRRVKLIIAGTGSFEDAVRRRAVELGVDGDVIFTGFVEDVAGILGAMDVQVNASYVSETSSLSIIEGMSIGLPAVASDCCGNPWLVEDGVSGLLFKPRDPADLAEKIAALMDDRARLLKLGAGAKEQYRSRFTGKIFAETLEDIYRGVAVKGDSNGK